MTKIPLVYRLRKKILDKYARENFEGVEFVAKTLRGSNVIDWEAYAKATHCREMGFDPAFHYVLAGEQAGHAAKDFDAKFYAARYPDAATSSVNKLYHYLMNGQRDGRYLTRSQLERPIPIVAQDPNRPTIFVVDHEASRTGAPILGLNLIQHLRKKYFVVSIVFKGGDLIEAFEEAADVTITCPKLSHDRKPVIDKVLAAYRPIFAVVNSIECRPIAADFVEYGIPYVTLVQEFGCFYGAEGLRELYAGAAAIIFAAKVIMESSLTYCPTVDRAICYLQPQGRSVIPPITAAEMQKKSASSKKDDIRSTLRPPGRPKRFIVAGLGTVDMRKGVDLFISTATTIVRSRPDLEIYFVWIGRRSTHESDAAFLLYIEQQLERAECGERITILPSTADIDTVYQEIDVLFLSSRLDPMPNVCIDAAMAHKPVVCFENGTGFAEVLHRTEDLGQLVVPYLDCGAAARVIERLADNPEQAASLGESIAQLAGKTFDMEAYVALIEKLGLEASAKSKTALEETAKI